MRTTGSATVGSGIVNKAGYSFQLSDCSEYSYCTALFDEYKLCAVKVEWFPRGNTKDVDNSELVSGVFYDAIDYDDASVSSLDVDKINQYRMCRAHRITQPIKRYFKPRFLASAYASSTTTGYGSRRGWLDCAYPGIPHYGWKYTMQLGGAPGTTYYYDTRVTYYLMFRARRM